jgi:hypothetical protein
MAALHLVHIVGRSLLSGIRGVRRSWHRNEGLLEADAIEIRMRATRRMDQMRQGQKATVGLNKGAQGDCRTRRRISSFASGCH